jgi:hypothetical protein
MPTELKKLQGIENEDELDNVSDKKEGTSKGCFQMVRSERLELSHLAAPEPKSGVSTNSTTTASGLLRFG